MYSRARKQSAPSLPHTCVRSSGMEVEEEVKVAVSSAL